LLVYASVICSGKNNNATTNNHYILIRKLCVLLRETACLDLIILLLLLRHHITEMNIALSSRVSEIRKNELNSFFVDRTGQNTQQLLFLYKHSLQCLSCFWKTTYSDPSGLLDHIIEPENEINCPVCKVGMIISTKILRN
jgi:hypothetical protein